MYCWRFLSRSLEPCKLQCSESLTLVPWGRHELESSTSLHLLRCREVSFITTSSFGSFLCFMAAMVDPISIAEYLSKAILELKNRSDQVNILKHCYLVSHMTDPTLQLKENQKELYWITNDVINSIYDLQRLRQQCSHDRVTQFDDTLQVIVQSVFFHIIFFR